jgi:hypothetical protein
VSSVHLATDANTISKKELISIRDNCIADENFIYDSWLNGNYYGHKSYCKDCKREAPYNYVENIPQSVYFKNYREVVRRILSRPTTQVKVACLKQSPDIVLAFSVFEPGTLHWVWVKPEWRKIGLATDLLPPDIQCVTHMTKSGKGFRYLKFREAIFNPFLV